MEQLKEVLGLILIISGLCNGVRYHWSASSIRSAGTAKGHSRKSMNTGMADDFIRFLYGFAALDLFIIISAFICLIFMVEKWYIIYLLYPYKKRGLLNFKRPGLWKYFINSLIPNHKRPRL
jgi:hypothetical protein